MLQVAQLRSFHEVLACGSFAAAGERLGLTASAVSQQINALERALGLRLFVRGARSIRPTASAVSLGLRVNNVLNQLDTVEREARAIAEGTRGVVRIGSFPTASVRLLPGALAHMASRQAGVDVLLDEAEPDELLARVESGLLDLAIVYHYDSQPAPWPAGITATPLLTESLILLTGVDDPKPPTRLIDAAELPWVASRERTAGVRHLETLCSRDGFVPRVTYRSNDYDVVRALVAAGLGVAAIPALAHTDAAGTTGTVVPTADAGRTVSLIHNADQTDAPLQVVVRAIRHSARSLRSGVIRPR